MTEKLETTTQKRKPGRPHRITDEAEALAELDRLTAKRPKTHLDRLRLHALRKRFGVRPPPLPPAMTDRQRSQKRRAKLKALGLREKSSYKPVERIPGLFIPRDHSKPAKGQKLSPDLPHWDRTPVGGTKQRWNDGAEWMAKARAVIASGHYRHGGDFLLLVGVPVTTYNLWRRKHPEWKALTDLLPWPPSHERQFAGYVSLAVIADFRERLARIVAHGVDQSEQIAMRMAVAVAADGAVGANRSRLKAIRAERRTARGITREDQLRGCAPTRKQIKAEFAAKVKARGRKAVATVFGLTLDEAAAWPRKGDVIERQARERAEKAAAREKRRAAKKRGPEVVVVDYAERSDVEHGSVGGAGMPRAEG